MEDTPKRQGEAARPSEPRAHQLRFAAVSAAVALSLLGDALLYALLPAKPQEFSVLVWQVGILLGANRIVRLLTNELAGRLVQKRRTNRPLIWAMAAGALITAFYALPVGFWLLLAARMAWGACWSMLRIEGYVAALTVSTSGNRGRVFAVYQAVTRFGQGGGLLLGGLLSDLLGIPRTFLIFSAATMSAVLFLLKAPAPPPAAEMDPPREAGSVPRDTGGLPRSAGAGRRPGRVAAALRGLPLALWSCALALTMTEQMVANLTGRFVAERIGAATPAGLQVATLTGLLLSFRSFAPLVLGPATGLLSDRFGRKRIMTLLLAVQCLSIAGIAFLNRWELLLACLLLQFALGMASRLLVYTIAGDLAPAGGGALHMGRFATFADLGTALGPMVAFALYSAHGFLPVAGLSWALLLGTWLALQRFSFEIR